MPSFSALAAGGAAGEDLDDALELVQAVPVTDDPRDCASASPGRERDLGPRRLDRGERGADGRLRRFDLRRGRRIAWEQGGGQAQRAEVDRAHPGGTEQLGADDHLGRAAADVADRDDSFSRVRARDCPREGEAAFLLGRDDADVGCGRTADRVEQALWLVALPAGRSDDRFQLAHSELPRDACVLHR